MIHLINCVLVVLSMVLIVDVNPLARITDNLNKLVNLLRWIHPFIL